MLILAYPYLSYLSRWRLNAGHQSWYVHSLYLLYTYNKNCVCVLWTDKYTWQVLEMVMNLHGGCDTLYCFIISDCMNRCFNANCQFYNVLSIVNNYQTTWTRESDLKWMSFPDGLYIWKLFKCLKLSGEMRLNTLDCRLLLRLIYMQDCYVHHLISSCILQNLI